MLDIDDLEAAGLLSGLESETAKSERAALVSQLMQDGFSLEELRAAAEQGRLALLPVERMLKSEGSLYTSVDIAEKTELPLELWMRLWRALGFAQPDPEEIAFGDSDLEAAKTVVHFFEAGISEDALVQIGRIIGHDMSKLGETLRQMVGEALLQPGDTELTVGLRYASAVELLVPMLTPLLEYVLKVHLREQIKTDVISQTELLSGRFDNAKIITAAFADLVGFTQFGERVTPSELGATGTELIQLTSAAIAPPVKFVKSAGDGVLLVSTDPAPLLDAALTLVQTAEEHQFLPQLRVGVASGEAIPQGGDWFGRPVNLASRITGVARPGSVLATKPVKEELADSYSWSYAGARRLDGIRGNVPLYRARRLGPL